VSPWSSLVKIPFAIDLGEEEEAGFLCAFPFIDIPR